MTLTDSPISPINCMRCGLCLAVCPTYQATGTEPLTPRGRIALIQAFAESKLLATEKLAWYVNSCLGCFACTTVCPPGVKVAEQILIAKIKIGYRRPFVQRLVLQNILPFPKRQETFPVPFLLYYRLGLHWLIHYLKIVNLFPKRLQILEAWLPRFSLKPLRHQLAEATPAKGRRKQRIGFFLGCAQNLIFGAVGLATVAVLSENSCEVVIPQDLRCCGMPLITYGGLEMAKKLARHNIDAFASAKVEMIVTDCATCGSFTKRYHDLLKDDPAYAEPALAFSQKIQDISQFLTETITLREEFGEVKGKVSYHDPCHLVRGQGISQQPRYLLKLIPGLELVEMKEADWCCGGAGTYIFDHYELSTKILDRKMTNVMATEANVIATGCPSCQLQLRLGMNRAGLRIQVVHLVQLLNKAYQGIRKT